ncbi:MAG: acylphosphatase [Anaerolineae bacterium]|nr:acylphosphatase [Phycisphaerae bacterium]
MSADRSTSASSSHSNARREIRFSGHVQGVGFRYTTQDIARQFDVRGYVRNLPDGKVELIVEGDEREIDRLVRSIENRMGSFIRNVTSSLMPATGEFRDFSIRH